jgi:hypothetical protein
MTDDKEHDFEGYRDSPCEKCAMPIDHEWHKAGEERLNLRIRGEDLPDGVEVPVLSEAPGPGEFSKESPPEPRPSDPTPQQLGLTVLNVYLWDRQVEATDSDGQYIGRRFKPTEVTCKGFECTAGALVWQDENSKTHGLPWWRVASFEEV